MATPSLLSSDCRSGPDRGYLGPRRADSLRRPNTDSDPPRVRTHRWDRDELLGCVRSFPAATGTYSRSDRDALSGLRVILSESPIPEASVIECVLDLRKATFRYEREAKEPRKLRAVGGSNWMAQADHQSRLYRFE